MQEADVLERALRRVLSPVPAMRWWWRLRGWRMALLHMHWGLTGWLRWRWVTGRRAVRALVYAVRHPEDPEYRAMRLADARSDARAFVRGRYAD